MWMRFGRVYHPLWDRSERPIYADERADRFHAGARHPSSWMWLLCPPPANIGIGSRSAPGKEDSPGDMT